TAPKSASVASVFERGPSHPGDEAPLDHGFGLARLPASTLFAVRVVSVGGLSEAWSRLAVVQALGGFSGLHGLLQEPLAALKGKVTADVPGGEALLSALERIEGEAVVGVTEVWPELAAG